MADTSRTMIDIKYIIYDLDGLLLDTEPFYTQVNQFIASRFGKSFDWSIKSKMIGLRANESAGVLIESLRLPISPEDYLKERKHMLEELFPQAKPMAGAERLTRHFYRHRIPQAIATSSDRRNFDLKISRHGNWFSIFDSFVQGDDPEVRRGKPAPDIFQVAARRMNALPEKCLVFEDAPSGLKAALAAGMSVVAVPDPNMDWQEYPEANQILASLEEFDPAYWGLPPFD
jgi:pseudouridine 5'-phosphatase